MGPLRASRAGGEAPLDERNQTENQEPASTDEADVLPQPPSAVRGGPAPGPAPRPLTQFLTCRILRLHHALDAQAVAILSDISGIGLGQWRVLAMVGAGGVMTARDPARATGLDPAFISRTVRSLEDASLLWTGQARRQSTGRDDWTDGARYGALRLDSAVQAGPSGSVARGTVAGREGRDLPYHRRAGERGAAAKIHRVTSSSPGIVSMAIVHGGSSDGGSTER